MMDRYAHQPESPPTPARVALLGAGGYGEELARVIGEHGPGLPHPLVLSAACDTRPGQCEAMLDRLGLRGVRVLPSAEAIADHPAIDAVWLPLPIHLHAEYAEMMLSAGKAVMIEKPAAGSVAEVDRMITARDRAGRTALIGYQEIYDPSTLRLKRLLLGGGLGAVRGINVRACWPRSMAYFTRNDWAGRRSVDGRPVHDSPLANALAHFANLALFFAGEGLHTPARPVEVRARAYRCASIENFDTVMIDSRTDAGARLLVWLTHAATREVDPVIRIQCERGVVTRRMTDIVIERDAAGVERWGLGLRDPRPMLDAFGAALSGRPPTDCTLATLELARPHVELVEAVAACPVEDVAESLIERAGAGQDEVAAVRGIEPWFEQLDRDAASIYDSDAAAPATDRPWLSLPAAVADA